MKEKDNKDIEKILLNDETYEKFLSSKIETEFEQMTKEKKSCAKVITDIKDAPQELLLTKQAIYVVMNKQSKTKSYINGVQADGFLGANNSLRTKFLSKEIDSFVCGDTFVKFYKLRI